MKNLNEDVMIERVLIDLDFYHALSPQQRMEEGQVWVGHVKHYYLTAIQNQILVASCSGLHWKYWIRESCAQSSNWISKPKSWVPLIQIAASWVQAHQITSIWFGGPAHLVAFHLPQRIATTYISCVWSRKTLSCAWWKLHRWNARATASFGGQLAKGSISSSPSLDSLPESISLLTDSPSKLDDELVRGGHSMSTGTHESEVRDPEVGARDLSDGSGCAGGIGVAVTWETMDGCFDWVLKSKGSVIDCIVWVLRSKGSTEGCFVWKLESTERDGALVFFVGPQSSSHAEVPLADGFCAGCPMLPDIVGAEWIPFDKDGDAFTSVLPFSVTVTPRFSSILLWKEVVV